jgi:hypothetical protein
MKALLSSTVTTIYSKGLEMNFLEKIEFELQQNGMPETMAKAVLEAYKAGEAKTHLATRWHEDVSNYPELLWNLVWVCVKNYALKYIDDHAPKAWFRIVFAPQEEQEAFMQNVNS